MKVGILTEIINSRSGARAPLEIAKYLRFRGHTVIVYGYATDLEREVMIDLEKSGVKVSVFPKPSWPILGKYPASLSLYKQLLIDAPEVLTFSGTPPFFIGAKFTGIPILRIYQGIQFNAFSERRIPGKKLPLLDHLINALTNIPIYLIDFMSFRLSDDVVAISEYAAKEGENLYKRKATKVIYHGTSSLNTLNWFTKRSQKSQVRLLSVSRLTPYKGFHLLLEAIKKIKSKYHILLTIAGSQPKWEYVNYLKKLGGTSVKIVVNPSNKKLTQLYIESDLYVTADRLLYFGLPVTEAALYKLPSVAWDFAAAKEIVVHGKTGFVAKNMSELTQYTERLINNQSLRRRFGQAAHVRVRKHFTWEGSAKLYETVLRTLI